jgi:hypothetical protein
VFSQLDNCAIAIQVRRNSFYIGTASFELFADDNKILNIEVGQNITFRRGDDTEIAVRDSGATNSIMTIEVIIFPGSPSRLKFYYNKSLIDCVDNVNISYDAVLTKLAMRSNGEVNATLKSYVIRYGNSVTYLDSYEIKPLIPSQAIVNEFATAGTDNITSIASHNDNTYNYGEAGQKDTFQVAGVTSNYDPAAVCVHYRAQYGAGGDVNIIPIINNVDDDTLELSPTYREYTVLKERNPIGNAFWTTNSVNELVIGYKSEDA